MELDKCYVKYENEMDIPILKNRFFYHKINANSENLRE